MTVRGMFRPGMRGYIIPLVAGVVLAISAFLPWVIIGEIVLRGFPDTMALWIVGLGTSAAVLATLSLITRKNSRHPLLLVGLVALGITCAVAALSGQPSIPVLALFGGLAVPLYLAGWLLIPEVETDRSVAEDLLARERAR